MRPGGSEQHVLVVDGPLATSLGLQLVVRVPLRDVGVGVAKRGSPPNRFAPTQGSGGRWRVVGGVGAGERLVARLGDGDGAGAGGGVGAGAGGAGGGGRLAGAASQAAVSQAGLGAPPMEGERDEQSA